MQPTTCMEWNLYDHINFLLQNKKIIYGYTQLTPLCPTEGREIVVYYQFTLSFRRHNTKTQNTNEVTNLKHMSSQIPRLT